MSAFSFHCLICFDAFDSKIKVPVVLPCGHTYVCCDCAARLDRCMECRAPLTADVPDVSECAPPPPQSATPSPGRHRYSRQPQSATPVRRKKMRLPCPKNVVLLSLIETSEPTSAEAYRKRTHSSDALCVDDLGKTDFTSKNHRKTRSMDALDGLSMDAMSRDALLDIDDDDDDNDGLVAAAVAMGAMGISRSESNGDREEAPTILTSLSTSSSTDHNFPDPLGPPELHHHAVSMFAPSIDEDDEIDADKEEERAIKVGTHVATGACGTYAVSSKTGIVVHRTLPVCTSGTSNLMHPSSDPDVEQVLQEHYDRKLQRGELDRLRPHYRIAGGSSLTWVEKKPKAMPGQYSNSMDSSMHSQDGFAVEARLVCLQSELVGAGGMAAAGEGSDESNGCNNGEEEGEAIRLSYGDRVQVVSFEGNGWVKLARGYGYVSAQDAEDHLVKVGGCNDKASQVEAVLREIYLERTHLRRERQRLQREESNLEYVSSGMLMDLEKMLIQSERDEGEEDMVVVPAPEGIPRSKSELFFLLPRVDNDGIEDENDSSGGSGGSDMDAEMVKPPPPEEGVANGFSTPKRQPRNPPSPTGSQGSGGDNSMGSRDHRDDHMETNLTISTAVSDTDVPATPLPPASPTITSEPGSSSGPNNLPQPRRTPCRSTKNTTPGREGDHSSSMVEQRRTPHRSTMQNGHSSSLRSSLTGGHHSLKDALTPHIAKHSSSRSVNWRTGMSCHDGGGANRSFRVHSEPTPSSAPSSAHASTQNYNEFGTRREYSLAEPEYPSCPSSSGAQDSSGTVWPNDALSYGLSMSMTTAASALALSLTCGSGDALVPFNSHDLGGDELDSGEHDDFVDSPKRYPAAKDASRTPDPSSRRRASAVARRPDDLRSSCRF